MNDATALRSDTQQNESRGGHGAWTPEGETAPALTTQDAVIDAIATIYDPEIPVNIYELGLIYAIDIEEDGRVKVEMTLTAPACPSAQELPSRCARPCSPVPGVTDPARSTPSGTRPGIRAG